MNNPNVDYFIGSGSVNENENNTQYRTEKCVDLSEKKLVWIKAFVGKKLTTMELRSVWMKLRRT